MTQNELRHEFNKLIICDTISDCHRLLNIYSELLFNIVLNHHNDVVHTNEDADAKLLVQMMLTKTLHLKKLVEGISFRAKERKSLNNIIDPTVLAVVVRNIYETTCLFNLIYRNSKSNEEKRILYLMWVHSGLKYRQGFKSVIISEENKIKQERELLEIEKIVKEIHSSNLYQNLNEKNQKKIDNQLKIKSYLIRFENNEVITLHWHDFANVMKIREGMLDTMYGYFSLYSHPSHVSVFQYGQLFQVGDEYYLKMTAFILKNAFLMLSIFISDYINLFPSTLITFEKLETIKQTVINFNNTLLRGDEYSINDCLKALG